MSASQKFPHRRGFFFLFVFLLIILTYFRLPFTFYQQDEWQVMGFFMTGGVNGVLSEYSLFEMLTGDGRLLSVPIQYVFYHYFPFQVAQVALFAISLHFFNAVLLYLFLNKLTKNQALSAISVVFFATASISQQSVTWMAASTTTLPSAFFALLSLFSYVSFLDNKKRKWMILTIVSFLLSYFFKQSSIFLLFVYPFTYFVVYGKKASITQFLRKHLLLIVLPLMLLLAVLLNIAFEDNPSGLIVTASSDSWQRLFVHAVFYPIVSFSHLFVGGEIVYGIAEFVGSVSYQRIWGQPFAPIVRETIGGDFVSVMLSAIIGFVFYVIAKKSRQLRNPILWGSTFALLSFLPYAILEKQTSYLESRYYYLGVVGGGVLFACLFIFLKEKLMKIFRLSGRKAFLLCAFFVAVYVLHQIVLVHKSIQRDVLFAEERKAFLMSLSSTIPTIGNKSLFFIAGSNEYFLETNRVPFQQGIGYTLMVWYYDTGFIPDELIKSNHLWVIGSEGYKEVDEKGFGVFSDFDSFKKAAIANKVSEDQMYGLYYDGENMQLSNISEKVRASFSDMIAEHEIRQLSTL